MGPGAKRKATGKLIQIIVHFLRGTSLANPLRSFASRLSRAFRNYILTGYTLFIQKIMIIFKSTILITAVLGLIILLGHNLEWFVNKDRVKFLDIISEKLECSPEHPGAQIFLKSYFYPLQMTKEEKDRPIDKIVFVCTFTKGYFPDGNIRKDIVSGTIKVRNKDGQVTPGLCEYSELKSWAKETYIWKWIAWGLLAISVISQLILFYYEICKQKNV